MKRTLLPVIALAVLLPSTSDAQVAWTELSTIGYGGAGFGLGLAAVWDMDQSTGSSLILISTITGAVTGFRAGRTTERLVRAREPLGSERLLAMRAGTVLGCAALGTVAAAYRVMTQEDNAAGEDERTVRNCIVGGAVVGVIAEVLQERWISGWYGTRPVHAFVAPAPDGGVVVGASIAWDGPRR